MHYIANFFAGAFLCNCIPHLVSGLQGTPFPTPFAKPRGVGDSAPPTNVLWGFFNLLAGACLLSYYPVSFGLNWSFIALAFGALQMGGTLAVHFGRVMRDRRAG